MRRKATHDGQPIVTDVPPRNPFDEPIPADLSDGADAELTQGTLKPSETVVEYPLSPTDTNPNPHGNRDEPFVAVATKDSDGNVQRTAPEEGSVEIEASHSDGEPEIHLGDGRTLAHGHRAKVSADVAKDLISQKKAKRVH